MENIVLCPKCNHGAAFHGEGSCRAAIRGGCKCMIVPSEICEQVLVVDRKRRDQELDAYIGSLKART